MDKIKINRIAIPDLELEILASTVIDAAQKFYSDPENIRKFEAWKAQRNADADNKKSSKKSEL